QAYPCRSSARCQVRPCPEPSHAGPPASSEQSRRALDFHLSFTYTPRIMLTKRQHAAYEFITGFIQRERYAPSYDEIRRHLGVRSLNAVAKLVAQLRRRGALAEAPHNAKRSLTPVWRRRAPRRAEPAPAGATVPLLGTIAA